MLLIQPPNQLCGVHLGFPTFIHQFAYEIKKLVEVLKPNSF